jgi:hypothetical protein
MTVDRYIVDELEVKYVTFGGCSAVNLWLGV